MALETRILQDAHFIHFFFGKSHSFHRFGVLAVFIGAYLRLFRFFGNDEAKLVVHIRHFAALRGKDFLHEFHTGIHGFIHRHVRILELLIFRNSLLIDVVQRVIADNCGNDAEGRRGRRIRVVRALNGDFCRFQRVAFAVKKPYHRERRTHFRVQ